MLTQAAAFLMSGKFSLLETTNEDRFDRKIDLLKPAISEGNIQRVVFSTEDFHSLKNETKQARVQH